MKQLLFLCLLVFFSCTNGNDYVSIRQIDSHHPITVGIEHDSITYIDFPLAFQINRLSPKTVTLLGHAYKCSSSLSSGYKGWDFNGIILFNVNGKVGYSPKGENWWQIDRKQREYVVFIRYQQLSQEAQKLLRKQIEICPDNGEVKIGSIQQLRKKDKKLISSFLQKDSIFFTFSHRDFSNNYMIDDIYMPVEVR